MEELGLQPITGVEELEEICEEVLRSNKEEVCLIRDSFHTSFPSPPPPPLLLPLLLPLLQVIRYQSGRTKLLGYFIGEVMKRTGRRGDPSIIRRILVNMLESNKR